MVDKHKNEKLDADFNKIKDFKSTTLMLIVKWEAFFTNNISIQSNKREKLIESYVFTNKKLKRSMDRLGLLNTYYRFSNTRNNKEYGLVANPFLASSSL